MVRALLIVLVACGAPPQRSTAPAPQSLAVVPRAPTAESVTPDDAQDHVPYVEPPPPDWTAPPLAFELPVVPAAATLFATISRIVVVDRAGGVTRGDNKMPLPDQIDPATLAPPLRPPAPPPAPGDKPPPRIVGTGPISSGPLTLEMPKRTMPQHLSGVVANWGDTITLSTVVFAHRENSALKVYDAVRSELFVSSTALAVTTDAGLRAFRMTFDSGIGGGIDRAYLEVALAGGGARVQAIVADKPVPGVFDRAASDTKAIAAAYTAARKLPQLGKGITVWIRIVDDDVTYARLVEVLEGLRAAGAVHTALSRARPISEPFAFGGVTSSNAVLGKVDAPGNFAAIARRYIKRNMQKVDYCYEKELLAKSNLAGEVNVEFTIDLGGTVDKVTSTGVDSEVSSCISKVIKGITFPKPQDGEITVRTTVQLAPPKVKKK